MIYVDKTRLIHEVMNVSSFVFLSRPRRFGKSLLTTTIKDICQGNRVLFQGLWIEDKIDWQPSPVLLINSTDVNQLSVLSLLFQTGYLTVKKSELAVTGRTFDLSYPNYEVTQAFQQHLLADYFE